jgi:hypothetical protein
MTRKYVGLIVAVGLLGTLSAVAYEPSKHGKNSAGSDQKNAEQGSAASRKGDKKNDGQKNDGQGKKGGGKNKANNFPGFTKAREAAALTFVRAHHPELAELLEQLKDSNQQEYQRAIRDLFLSSERLAQVEERNPARYELELKDWRLQSRIQLLVARMTMKTDPGLEVELRQALTEQLDVREELLEFEHERAQARLAEASARLDEFRSERPQLVEKWQRELLERARDPGAPTNDSVRAGKK